MKTRISCYLNAFADGELDADDGMAILTYMTSHPEAVRRVLEQHQLRFAAQKLAKVQYPRVPDLLRAQIHVLAEASDPDLDWEI